MITSMIEQLYDFTFMVLNRNAEGITHAESLVSPAAGGNCMNWVVGHIVATRVPVLKLADAEPVWTEFESAFYRRGSAPVAGDRAAAALPFERLLTDLAESQARLKAALGRITPEALEAPGFSEVPGGLQPRARQLAIFNFHESYHAGQTGILRRLLGRPGAIQ